MLKKIWSDFKGEFSIGKLLFLVIAVVLIVPVLFKLLSKIPGFTTVIDKAKSVAPLVVIGSGLALGLTATETRAEVVTKGGMILAPPSRLIQEAGLTNYPNFYLGARLRVVGQNGTNQLGVATNGYFFIVGQGASGTVSNSIAIDGVITNATGTGKMRFRNGLLIGID